MQRTLRDMADSHRRANDISDCTPDSTRSKLCPKCGKTKPATSKYFARNKSRKGGLDAYCKSCTKAYYIENRQRLLERANENYIANREKRLKQAAVYRAKNKEKISAWKKVWGIVNIERVKAKRRAYYVANKERQAERSRAWGNKNREAKAAHSRKRKAIKRNAEGHHTGADVKAQYKRQKGRCYYCGCKVGEDYHVDHVIPLSRGGSNGPENIVIACPSCNLSKKDKLPHEWPQGGRLL